MPGYWKVEAVGDEVLLTLYPNDDDERLPEEVLDTQTIVLTPGGARTLGEALLNQATYADEVAGR